MIGILLSILLCACEGLTIDRLVKTSPSDWTSLGGSQTRSNQCASSFAPPLRQVWQYDAGSGITATPLVRDNIVIVSTLKGELHAVNLLSGKRIGYITLDGPVTGTPVWSGSVVMLPISTETETIETIDIDDGTKKWKAKFGQCESSPLLCDKNLYVTSLNGSLYCLNAANGDKVWEFKTADEEKAQPIRSSPATDGTVIVFGCDNGILYGVDRIAGKERWRFTAGESIFASPVVTKGRVIVGSLNGKIYCLDIRTGRMEWSFDTKSSVFGSASTNDTLAFVGTTDGHCYAIDVEKGTVQWSFTAKSVINSAPLIAGDLLCVGSLDKNLYILDPATGKQVWQYEAEGRIKVSPVLYNGTLLITSEDNYVTALK
jgi:outer membrane protein assembly factor BamB